ncbi:MAG TPA: hypothetical protein VFY14_02415 [Streptomyces sp.]|nr:hypothetical protein [Streptomyces sp.]
MPLRAAALRFPFGRPAVASVGVGTAGETEVRDNARMSAHGIPDAMWHALVEHGLLAEGLPPAGGVTVERAVSGLLSSGHTVHTPKSPRP